MLLCGVPPVSAAAPGTRLDLIASRLQAADLCYRDRANLSNVNQGLQLLRQVASDDSSNYETWWRISRFQNFLGREQEDKDDQAAMRSFESGVEAGRRAVALEPNRVEGHFWLGANFGLLAEDEGWIKGLRLLNTVRGEMETVVRLDPNYEQAAGQRTLARLYYRAPFFKGGDKQRSIRLLEDCLRRFPTDSFSLLYLGDDYLALGRRDEARGVFQKILNLGPDPAYGPELAENQAEARDRLQHEFR